jgi:hypothetical protein
VAAVFHHQPGGHVSLRVVAVRDRQRNGGILPGGEGFSRYLVVLIVAKVQKKNALPFCSWCNATSRFLASYV